MMSIDAISVALLVTGLVECCFGSGRWGGRLLRLWALYTAVLWGISFFDKYKIVLIARNAADPTKPAGMFQGHPGPVGMSCWDRNSDGKCDLSTEDLNGDGECTHADCPEYKTAAQKQREQLELQDKVKQQKQQIEQLLKDVQKRRNPTPSTPNKPAEAEVEDDEGECGTDHCEPVLNNVYKPPAQPPIWSGLPHSIAYGPNGIRAV